jgi:ribA/ribD-fused uncharacterized protein
MEAVDLIDGFDGPHRYLSNFFTSPVHWDGIDYPSAEAAFAAGKTLDQHQRAWIAAASTPGEAKRRGRSVALRPDWNDRHRYEVMQQVLEAKFRAPDLRDRLADTGTALLIEANTWHDQQWGCCRCGQHRTQPGHNRLGQALMRLRDQITAAPADRWLRIAATGHRPQFLPADSHAWIRAELRRVVAKLIAGHGAQTAISGGAMGVDLWWADAAHDAGAAVWLYQPFPQQPDRWTPDWRQHHHRVREMASRTATLGPQPSTALLYGRNEWMIRDCDAVVAVADPEHTRGGTYHALRHALGYRPVIYINVRDRDTRLIMPAA